MEQRSKLSSQRGSFDWVVPGQNMSRGAAAKVYPKQRYSPYYGKHPNSSVGQQQPSLAPSEGGFEAGCTSLTSTAGSDAKSSTVTLQISNLDSSFSETMLWNCLVSMLKPITPVISLKFESHSCAKLTVPSHNFAKSVIAHLHRKKVGHKRILVSYNRDISSHEYSTLCCQVACLLKDIPDHSLPLYKFRELFQSRFKMTINQMELYKMKDLCTISFNESGDKCITLNSNYVHCFTGNPIMNTNLQHSVPYCRIHFQQEQFKGWAEMDIEPLPNVMLTLSQMRIILQSLLKSHQGDIPIASLLYCIRCTLDFPIFPNDNGVNFEHLISCISGTKICNNAFGIRILTWGETNDFPSVDSSPRSSTDPLHQISKEVIELLKVTPKATLQFNKFIPAYHNHFGKQCRVADYGYTRLIDLFDALSAVVQVMGEGENRLITLTHRTQIRRFTADLYKVLKCQLNKSLLLSQLSDVFAQVQFKSFDITDYGVCYVTDILDGLRSNNTVVIQDIPETGDMLISIPKREQTPTEIENTCVFAAEVVELCRNASQYSILFQKFVRYYHYNFGLQCRLSDYGFLKLADLLEAISGVIELEFTNYEQKRIFLSPKVAQRVFVEQIYQILSCTVNVATPVKLTTLLHCHKDKFGYQILPQSLGFMSMEDAIQNLPFVEVIRKRGIPWILCHYNSATFNSICYIACSVFLEAHTDHMLLIDFKKLMQQKSIPLMDSKISAMSNFFELGVMNGLQMIFLSPTIKFLFSVIDVLSKTFGLSIVDLKSMMNLSISSCFAFGYPNISSMLMAYPDIFILSPSTNISERSAVKLNEDFMLLKYNLSDYLESIRNNSSSEHNFSQNSMFSMRQFSSLPPPPGLGFPSTSRPFDMSTESLYGHPSATSTSYKHSVQESQLKLFERRNGPDSLLYGLNSLSHLASLFCDPPKPDTPPSNSNLPYWLDPVWRYQKTPPIECLNIQLPELSTVNVFPIVMSPFALHDQFQFQVPPDSQQGIPQPKDHKSDDK
ncbi:meiosis regulator and mRNA stability factor 1 [Phlebotomus argentipes]|uniref:meiosis regulator and mRNA stability factor 1 n=1 Tax=Phlebotomus argentipes TaxID=94469 RepID=UPI00289333A3|nr:meiosis regulator and mRNA stability factor 1 [Phlebotomus argentipes]